MFVVNYPLFLPVCRLITDQSIKTCRETSPSLIVFAHNSAPDTRVIISTSCYFILVPDYLAEILELRILISIQ